MQRLLVAGPSFQDERKGHRGTGSDKRYPAPEPKRTAEAGRETGDEIEGGRRN